MNAIVVDASVVAAAFFPEPCSKNARVLLTSGATLHAPDLIYPEVANVIWKRQVRKEISGEEARELLADVVELPLDVAPSDQLVETALELAIQTGRTVCDCLYVALAIAHDVKMISGDRRLVNALSRGPLQAHVAWIGDSC
ncbi:MAG TPA: PIN domain nuclease [Planctomycetaceae bacterium]|nr:PIN domain nuclease [Planctomycetaceae bacterium]